jgi:excisionase family DNA binding protein
LTVSQVAEWLAVSRGWVHDHASGRRQPILPSVKMGKSIRFREADVEAWIQTMSERAA